MHRVTLIECWFGPFTPWFAFYLQTCAYNPTIQYLIFHDRPHSIVPPANVKFILFSKEDLEIKASALLGVTIKLPTGYKAGDLRPTLGAIFDDYIKDADFWGYNDSDMFWGDIRKFLTPKILDEYDIITGCRTSICGQFTIFRNSGVTKEIYKIIPDYINGLRQPHPLFMEEVTLDEAVSRHGLRIYRRQLQVHDMGSSEWENKARELELKEQGNLDQWFWEEGDCRWENGKLIHLASGKETMFFHFKSWKGHWRKEHRVPRLPFWNDIYAFDITRDGIRPYLRSSTAAFKYSVLYFIPCAIVRNFRKTKGVLRRIAGGLRRRALSTA